MIRVSLVAGLVVLVGPALAGPLDGRWAMAPADCAPNSHVSDRVPLTIVGDAFEWYESRCTVTHIDEIGGQASAWRVTRSCSGEGETWSVRSIFAVDRDAAGEPRQLIEIDLDEGHVFVRQHCD